MFFIARITVFYLSRIALELFSVVFVLNKTFDTNSRTTTFVAVFLKSLLPRIWPGPVHHNQNRKIIYSNPVFCSGQLLVVQPVLFSGRDHAVKNHSYQLPNIFNIISKLSIISYAKASSSPSQYSHQIQCHQIPMSSHPSSSINGSRSFCGPSRDQVINN